MSRKKEVEAAAAELDLENGTYQLHLRTSKGPIRINMWPDIAPEHCKNMLGLAKIGFYDDLTFHRIVPGFVIQGGCPEGTGTGGPGYKVDGEFNDRKHLPGVLSMARSQDPNSAGSQFFLCLEAAPFLDGQYTAFGQTADDESLATVKAIGAVETNSRDCPVTPVKIESATVVAL